MAFVTAYVITTGEQVTVPESHLRAFPKALSTEPPKKRKTKDAELVPAVLNEGEHVLTADAVQALDTTTPEVTDPEDASEDTPDGDSTDTEPNPPHAGEIGA